MRRFPPPKGILPRLACVRHAASVHPEPGSNSPYSSGVSQLCDTLPLLSVSHCSTVKLHPYHFQTKRQLFSNPPLIETIISTPPQPVKSLFLQKRASLLTRCEARCLASLSGCELDWQSASPCSVPFRCSFVNSLTRFVWRIGEYYTAHLTLSKTQFSTNFKLT